MKNVILFFAILLPFMAFSQEPLSYSEVIDVPNVDKNELYIRGREWFNENFKSVNDVLQINDKETGELVGKAYFQVACEYELMGKSVKVPAGVFFQISIWVKEGKYKYEFKNFNVPGSKDMSSLMIGFGAITSSDVTDYKFRNLPEKRMNQIYLSVKTNTVLKSKSLIESLKEKMSQKSKTTDWQAINL